jgi:type IV pilus assembly protein PilY1
MLRHKLRFLLGLILLAQVQSVLAEDIDLFVGRSTAETEAPNVLIVLDNTANWGPETKFQEQKAALQATLDSLVEENLKVNIGLMMYTESGGGTPSSATSSASNDGPDGGYVRAAIRALNADTLPAFTKLLTGDPDDSDSNGLDRLEDSSNSGKSGKTMAEAYLYFLGGDGTWEVPWSGNKKAKTDYTGNELASSPDSHAVWALPTVDSGDVGGNALDSKYATQYNSPYDPNSCADNYIIYIGNGPAQDSNNDSTEARNILQNMVGVGDYWAADYVAGPGEPNFQLTPPNSEGNLADEWAYYMNNDAPVKVSTYAIDLQTLKENQCDNNAPAGWSALMKNMSEEHGGGKYYQQCGPTFDSRQFALDLADAFRGILSRNSVFASVALPAAANEQSTFLNQVFVGVFRPDSEGLPRWTGNLKQYKIGLTANGLETVDANDIPLVDTTDTENGGFVEGCAVSYWTPSSENAPYYFDYLKTIDTDPSNDPVENCDGDPAGSNTKDGNIVEKGGQAYVLRSGTVSSRKSKAYTCNKDMADCNTDGLIPFNSDEITASDMDANDPTDLENMIDWAIGKDVDDEDKDLVYDEFRPSVHGDIVHSQPVAIDYAGDPDNPEVVVFYGGNDGMLRAINGNQTADQGLIGEGAEFWTFMPPEFYGKIKRIRVNEDYIKFPATGPTAGQGVPGDLKDYGMDGPLSAYELDPDGDGDVDSRMLYAGMRRAGRMVYAFDVTSKTLPVLKWKAGCPNATGNAGCTTSAGNEWDTIGQTWSQLSVAYSNGYDPDMDSDTPNPLVVMGGGYDPCEDDDDPTNGVNNSCSGDHSKIGNSIYVLDALTGAVLTSLPTDRSVPGRVTIVPVSDDDPSIMFAYAADTGGNVYRISGGTTTAPASIGSTAPSSWVIKKIASLGCATDSTCNANRKFLFGPDVVRIPMTDKTGILIGSGDREKPLTDYAVTNGVQNYFYSLVDAPTSGAWLDNSQASNNFYNCGNNDLLCQSDNAITPVDPNDPYDPTLSISEKGWKAPLRAGEQVVTGAITLDNEVNFSTHIPAAPQSCDAEYGIATAYRLDYQNGDGQMFNFIGGGLVPTPVAGKVLIDGTPYEFCIGCGDDGSPLGAGKAGGGITWTQPRSRVFWNIDKVED